MSKTSHIVIDHRRSLMWTVPNEITIRDRRRAVGRIESFVDQDVPVAPTGLAVTTAENGKASLAWNANSEWDLAGYYLYVDGVRFNSDPIEGETYTAMPLNNEQEYDFYITAVDRNDNESPASSTVTATITDTEAPAAPQNVVVDSFTDTTIDISWDAVAAGDLDGYTVYVDGIAQNGSLLQTENYQITGRTQNIEYQIVVTATDVNGNESNGSDMITQTTQNVAPAAPTGLTSTAKTKTTIDLAWDANSEHDLAGYNVYVDGVKDNTTLIPGETFQVDGLTQDTEYVLETTAVDSEGAESDKSASITVRTEADCDLTIDSIDTNGDVTVNASSSNTPIEYSIWPSSKYSLDFDGVDDNVNHGDFFLADDFSIELRFKTDGAVSSEQALISKWSSAVSEYEWYLALKSNGQILFAKAAPNQQFPIDLVYYTNNSFDDGNWHQVHAVCENETVKIYVDGEEQVITEQTNNGYGGLNNTTIDIVIGDRDGYDTPFAGQIDEIALWSKGLSAEEVIESARGVYNGDEVGLEAYYRTEEGSGTILTDGTANGRNGTINGATYAENPAVYGWTTNNVFAISDRGRYLAKCRDANACTDEQYFSYLPTNHLTFNGTDQHVEVADHSSLDGMAEATFEAKIYIPADNKGVTYSTSFRTILAKGTHSTQDYGIYARYKQAEDTSIRHIIFIINGEAVRLESPSVPLDTVLHIACRLSSNGDVDIFVDGSLHASTTSTVSAIQTSANPLRIGWDGGSDRYLAGSVDEVRIWNIARTQQQIQDNLNAKLNGDETGLVSYYSMDKGFGDNVIDYSQNSNDGALVNNTSDEMWISGDL